MTTDGVAAVPAYRDPHVPIETRVDDLISRMTLEEKAGQMMNAAPGIPRLGIPQYDWWNECLHGVGRAGIATVFPQAIGLAATWNKALMARVATAISDEARAKHHEAIRNDNHEIYYGLTFWSPNINIFRDPRWGRGQETYGEDPYLTARMGVEFVKGLQGDDARYLKLVATPKHYAVHSGPEADRHHFNARASERDLRETYLPAFKATITEAKAVSIMGAYNRTNGEPCNASPTLLQQILRDEWGFQGYVVSDCGAIADIYKDHHVVNTPEEATAISVKAGCDLECGATYRALMNAVKAGLIDEATLDVSLRRLFTARMRLGMFDPPEVVPYARIPIEVNDCEVHQALALQAACESIVLLKNAVNGFGNGLSAEYGGNGFLPLDKSKLKTVAVIGPNADDHNVLLGNYNGMPSKSYTPLDGIMAALPDAEVRYAKGCSIAGKSSNGFAWAVEAAEGADVAVVCLGLSQQMEGEEGQEEGVEAGARSFGDRGGLDLPGVQEELLKAVYATGTPVVLVLLSGSAVAVNWADEHVPAIVEAWYPGQAGGTAIAEVLFGDYNPAGRLPVTFYKSVEQLPPFEDYRMEGRTYRYFTGQPLYAFGHGLSYTTFTYANLALSAGTLKAGEGLTVTVDVTNTGSHAGDEVVQLYLTDVKGSTMRPMRFLAGFERVSLQPGDTKMATFTVLSEQLHVVDAEGRWVVEPGEFQAAVGGGMAHTLTANFTVVAS
ncbi:MAG: glycoside hydrolase family 3 C-terminal domain-containing protein [Chloroflexi bacterium]|nr:glycoside hydrolase family 3 C-terminal domain-containing protein [Chloroflexota bacterium]